MYRMMISYLKILTVLFGLFGLSVYTNAQNDDLILDLEFSPDGTKIVGVGENILRLWDTTTEQVLLDLQTLVDDTVVLDVSWNPQGTRFATASDDETVRIWSAGEVNYPIGTLIDQFNPPRRRSSLLSSVEWSTDGQTLAIGFFNHAIGLQIWNAITLELIEERTELIEVQDMDWHPHPSHNLLATVSNFGGARVWDVNNASVYPSLICETCSRDPNASDTAVSWSGDGSRLAVGRLNGDVMIVDYSTDSAITIFNTGNWVMNIAWSPNDEFIATSDISGDIKIWNSSSGNFLETIAENSFVVDFGISEIEIAFANNLLNGSITIEKFEIVKTHDCN